MFVWAIFVFLDQIIKKEERKKDNSPLLDLLGFAAGKNASNIKIGQPNSKIM